MSDQETEGMQQKANPSYKQSKENSFHYFFLWKSLWGSHYLFYAVFRVE